MAEPVRERVRTGARMYEATSLYNLLCSEVLACTFFGIVTLGARFMIYTATISYGETYSTVFATTLIALAYFLAGGVVGGVFGRSSGSMMLPWLTLIQFFLGRFRRPGKNDGWGVFWRLLVSLLAQFAAPALAALLIWMCFGITGRTSDLGAPVMEPSAYVGGPAVGYVFGNGYAGVTVASTIVMLAHVVVSHDGWTMSPALTLGLAYGGQAAAFWALTGSGINPVLQFWAKLIAWNTPYAGLNDWIWFLGSLTGAGATYLIYLGWFIVTKIAGKAYNVEGDYIIRGGSAVRETPMNSADDENGGYDLDFGDHDRPTEVGDFYKETTARGKAGGVRQRLRM